MREDKISIFNDTIMKISQILETLNSNGGNWEVQKQVHALTEVQKVKDDKYAFNPGSGIPVKVFINIETGEMRLYPALAIDDSF